MGIIKQVEQELEQARAEKEQLEYECMQLEEQHLVLKQEGKSEEARNVSDLYASKCALRASLEQKIPELQYKLSGSKLGEESGLDGYSLYAQRKLQQDKRKKLRKAWDSKKAALKKAKEDYEKMVEEINHDIVETEHELKQTDKELQELMGVDEWAKMF